MPFTKPPPDEDDDTARGDTLVDGGSHCWMQGASSLQMERGAEDHPGGYCWTCMHIYAL